MEMRERMLEAAPTDLKDGRESWLDRARREARLVKEGLCGFADAAVDAVVEHPLSTAAEVATGVGVGIGLAYLSRGRGLGLVASRAAGAAAGMAFLKDAATNGGAVLGAMNDAWHSDRNWNEDARIMRTHLGRFAFDTVVMSAAGAAGGKVGHRLFDVKLGDLPRQLVPQMSERGISHDYYNKLMMAEYYTNNAANTEGKFSAEKVAKARERLPGSLKDLISYRDYWRHEVANYRASGAGQLDEKAAMNVLLWGNSDARELNKLSLSMPKYAGLDLDNPAVLDNLALRFKRARSIIYSGQDAGGSHL